MNGAVLPTYSVILGLTVLSFDPSLTEQERDESLQLTIIIAATCCVCQFIFAWASYTLMQQQAEKMAFNLKSLYLNSLMKQETAFFEKQQIEALPSKISENFYHIQEGSGEKLA